MTTHNPNTLIAGLTRYLSYIREHTLRHERWRMFLRHEGM